MLEFGAVVELVTMPACHAGGRGFESHQHRIVSLATVVVELVCHISKIEGSRPSGTAKTNVILITV